MTDYEDALYQGNVDNTENSYGGGSSPQPRSDDQNDSKSQHESRDYERESSRSREKEREKGRDKERDKNRDRRRDRDRDRDREKDRDRERHHRDRQRDRGRGRSERRDWGRDRDDDDYYRSRDYDRRRDYDRDREDRHRHQSRSRSTGRSEHRSKSRSRSRSRSRSKSKRISGFDMAPPASAMLATGAVVAAAAGQIPGTSPTLPGVFPNMFPLATSQPFGALPVMPVQAMTQQATRHARRVYVGGLPPAANEQSVATFFSHVMAAIGGNTAGPGDAVVNVYINHEKKFAFVEMRSVEEASNAMALDGIIFEGAPVKVRRPSDYNPSLAATLGPSQPNPNLNLAAVGLTTGSTGGLEGPDRIFVGGLPYYFTEAQIRELLESFGPLRGFDLVKDRETGNSKGYAFCVYQDLSVTDIACAALNGIKMGDKTLTVRRANQGATQPKPEQESILQHAQQQIAFQRLILQPQGMPTKVVCLTQALNVDDLRDDEEYEDIVEDMRQEGGKYALSCSTFCYKESGLTYTDRRLPNPFIYIYLILLSLTILFGKKKAFLNFLVDSKFLHVICRCIGECCHPTPKSKWRTISRCRKGISGVLRCRRLQKSPSCNEWSEIWRKSSYRRVLSGEQGCTEGVRRLIL
ncbi:splicing factor U2af large subunit B-like isoform X1 [Durio zibethinus]|uniref:Splicing factor U2af large subunit B-like isoform X1 n=1 Tax=Durio zibethinus TaxID=66656 RepID=A0A6P6AKP5_DURZI|nr:splicing factor U2af large subunit B-like isoform X1 [Durio zibethinus]